MVLQLRQPLSLGDRLSHSSYDSMIDGPDNHFDPLESDQLGVIMGGFSCRSMFLNYETIEFNPPI